MFKASQSPIILHSETYAGTRLQDEQYLCAG